MKGYKAFSKGLICKGFQYEEVKTYKTDKAICCQEGFHFCENPLDTLNYYDLCESEFAEVEALGKIDNNKDDTKHATTEIKIVAKLTLKDFIEASLKFVWESCKEKSDKNKENIASSGYSAQLASSGDSAQLASSGYYAKLASSGYSAQLASSGDTAQLASSGNCAKLASSGNCAQLASSGDSSQLASSGDCAKLELNGQYSVGACMGYKGIIKGKKGDWITLVEWVKDKKIGKWVPRCVKSVQIDGNRIKEDVFYKLENKKFVLA